MTVNEEKFFYLRHAGVIKVLIWENMWMHKILIFGNLRFWIKGVQEK